MENIQLKGIPIKEYDGHLERVEKENFDLKLQITHLKSRLKETSCQSFSVLPACECKKKEEETEQILTEAKTAMEALIREKEQIERAYCSIKNKVQVTEDENERLRKDCVKLSEHISQTHQREKESTRTLEHMKEEIVTIKSDLEQTERVKSENHKVTTAYTQLKEEYLKLEEFSRRIETEYKAEIQKTRIQAEEKKSLEQNVHDLQVKINEVLNHVKMQESHTVLGEKAIEELKKEKQQAFQEKDAVQRRAEEIIAERERHIVQLQNAYQKQKERVAITTKAIYKVEQALDQERGRVSTATQAIQESFGEIDKISEVAQSLLSRAQSSTQTQATQLTAMQKHTQNIQKEAQEALRRASNLQAHAETLKREKAEMQMEVEALQSRVKITPEVVRMANNLGLSEFTTLDNIFVRWSEDREKMRQVYEKKQEEREWAHKEQEEKRSRMIDEFQGKLQAALSELHTCRMYLEEKKSLIKSLKKGHGTATPMLRKINVSADK